MVLADRIRLANTRQLLRAFGGLNETYGCTGDFLQRNNRGESERKQGSWDDSGSQGDDKGS